MNLKKGFFLAISLFSTALGYTQEQGKVITTKVVSPTKSDKAREYYNKASDYFDQNNFKKAVELNKLAIAADTNYIDAYDNLGLAYRKLNLLDSAEYYYKYSFEKNPTNTTPLQNLAVIAELRNNFQQAKLLYLMITSMEPENPEGFFGMARMHLTLGENEEALKSGQMAEKLYEKINSPYIGDCYYILCITHLQLKNMDLAKKYLTLTKKAGLSIDPNIEKALK